MASHYAGEGSVYKRIVNGKTYWTAQVYLYKDPITEKWKKKTKTKKRKSDCVDWLVKIRADIASGKFSESGETTLRTFIEYWLDLYVKNNRAFSTFNLYKYYYYNKTLPSFIANKKMSEIISSDIYIHLKRQRDNGETITNLNSQLMFLNTVFNQAVKLDVITKNPAKSIEEFKPDKKEINLKNEFYTFTVEEQETIINSLDLDNNYHLAVYLLFSTGLRIGELLALRWEDIEGNQINITRQWTTVAVRQEDGSYKMESFFSRPKTENSIRKVPLPENVYKTLKPYMTKGLIFPSPRYKTIPMSKDTVLKYFRKLLDDIGIESKDKTLHKIRHAYATRLFEAGADLKTVADLMGHSSLKMLNEIYLHVSKDKKTQTVDLINKFF